MSGLLSNLTDRLSIDKLTLKIRVIKSILLLPVGILTLNLAFSLAKTTLMIGPSPLTQPSVTSKENVELTKELDSTTINLHNAYGYGHKQTLKNNSVKQVNPKSCPSSY